MEKKMTKKNPIRMEELRTLRGCDRAVYRMSDGTHQAEYYAAPRFVRNGTNDAWEAVDNTLVPAADGKYFENRRGTFTARFNREASAELFSLAEGNCRVTVSQMHSARRAAALCPCGDTGLRWENAEDNVDLAYAVTDTGVKETIVVKAPAEEYRYTFRLHGERVVPLLCTAERCITFVNEEGTADVFQIPAPIMQDAAGVLSDAVTYDLSPMEDGDFLLTVAADAAWMNDEARVFPVAIDPTVETLPKDVTVYSWDGATLVKSGSSVPVGSVLAADGVTYHENRMFLQLNPPALPQNALVQKVEVVFTQTASPTGGFPRIGLYRVENELAEGTFAPQNPVLLDYDRTASGVQLAYAFDITKQVQGALSPLNLMVKVVDGDLADGTFVRLYGHNSSYAPKFVVTYDPAYVTNPAARTHTHEIGRFGQGAVDLYRGNLTWECEDFAWGGNRLPVTLKHRFNSALAGKQYTAGCAEGLHVADFSAMKIGTGFALNVMQSVVADTNGAYHYVDENGCDTVLTAHTDENGNITHYADEDEVYTYTAADRKLKCGDETLSFDEAGRLVEIRDGYNNTQTVTYADGRITAVTDGAGRVFAFAYDTTGHLTSITAPDGSKMGYGYAEDLLTIFNYPDERRVEIKNTYDLPVSVELFRCKENTDANRVYTVRYAWADNHTVTGVTEYGYENGAEVQGTVTAFSRSPAARRTEVAVTNGEDTVYTAYHFDEDGESVGEYTYTKDADGTVRLVTGDGAGVANSINRLKNHTFEKGETVTAWQTMTNDENTKLNAYGGYADAPYGRRILRIDTQECTETVTANGAYQTVEGLPAGEYTYSAYVHVMKAYTGAGAYLRVTDGNGTVLAESEKLTKNEGWVRLSASFVLADTTTVQVQLLADGVGMCHINAPQLEDGGCATVYNHLQNGCAEDAAIVWTGGTVSTDECLSGTGALQLIAASVDAACCASQTVKPKMGAGTRETFTLSGWAKGVSLPDREREESEAPHFCLRAEVVYTDENIPTETFTADFAPALEEWQFASVQFCKSHYASVSCVKVYCDYSFNEGTAYFDNLQLVRDTLETGLSAEDFTIESEEIEEVAEETSEETTEETAEETDELGFEEARDAFGNTLTETTFTDGEFGTLYRAFGFNATGNDRTAETDVRGNTTEYAVNAITSRPSEVTDRCGNKTAYEYDAAGRTTKVTSKDANGTEVANVSYAYDAFDNMTAITRDDGMAYTLVYNPFHNLESIGINGKTEKLVQYTYKNGNGRLKEITYANGDKMMATYNGQGQMVAEKWYDASNTLVAHYKYVYDTAGNIVRSIDILASKEYTYTYEEGRIVRATESDIVLSGEIVTGKTIRNTVRYVYDSEGTLTKKIVTPANGTAQTTYYETTDENTVVKFKAGGKTVTSHSKTDAFGRKVFDELQLGTGFVSRQFIYHAGDVTDEHAQNGLLKSSATTQLVSQIVLSDGHTLSYEYDAEERITQVIDSTNEETVVTTYTYDALGQLLTETVNGVAVNTMTYDNYGNITSKNGVPYTYGDSNWHDLLTAYNGQTITYDAQGNPTSYRGCALSWEKGRQLVELQKPDGTLLEFFYNANGIRTCKAINGVRHDYVLEGTKILRETWEDDNGKKNTLMPLYDNEDSVCGILYNNTPYYFLKNLQGDIIAITNANGETVAKYSYDAWGVCTITQDDSGIGVINPYRYRGYYYDTETGLYYLQSRYYDAGVGRFINADEGANVEVISKQVLHNLCTYCEQDPVNYVDETGKAIWATIGKAFLGALNQYTSDIVSNIISQKKGWKAFKPCSSLWRYIASALSAIIAGGKIFKAIATALINSVANAIERFLKKEKTPLWRRIVTFLKDVALGLVSEFIAELIFSKVMSLTPRNYSKFAHSQYMKNAKITPNQIRQKMGKLVQAGMKTANVFIFFSDALIGAC